MPHCIRWFGIFLRPQFCMALYRCRELRHGRETFPFAFKLFCLFFQMFLEMRPTFFHHHTRPVNEVLMRVWGKMMPKMGLPKFLAMISRKALVLLTSEDDHVFVTLVFRYARIIWRGCPNIFFTLVEPPDDRGNINVFFELIQFHFLVLMNQNKIYSNTFFNLFY